MPRSSLQLYYWSKIQSFFMPKAGKGSLKLATSFFGENAIVSLLMAYAWKVFWLVAVMLSSKWSQSDESLFFSKGMMYPTLFLNKKDWS